MSNAEQQVFINELLYELHLCRIQNNPNRTINATLTNNDHIILGMNTVTDKRNTVRYSNGEEESLELVCSISHPSNPTSDNFPISIRVFDDNQTTRIFHLNSIIHYSIFPNQRK